jgi:hypothetical protein
MAITYMRIRRTTIPEMIPSVESQPGRTNPGWKTVVGDIGVATTGTAPGTTVPTTENCEELPPVATWTPFVTAN